MLPYLLIEENFQTPLGIVICGLNSTESTIKVLEDRQYDNGASVIYKTLAHNIELVTFKRRLPLFNGDTVKDTLGWIWRITKESHTAESLQLHCLLSQLGSDAVLGGSDPGEHLDSAQVHNDEWVLHLGTEDGEIMHTRALHEDWMPLRLKDGLSFDKSFTHVVSNGLVTEVPELRQGENIHFHYLAAYDKREEVKVNTWFAVDEFKRNLEDWVGIW